MGLRRSIIISMVLCISLMLIIPVNFSRVSADLSYVSQHSCDLEWATYLGESGSDVITDIIIDADGNLYVTGVWTNINGNQDMFLSKFDKNSSYLWTKTLGGNSDDAGMDLSIDSSGNIYIAGWTYSSNFPATEGVYQPNYGGSCDGFLAKFNSNGTLLWSTYFGGSSYDDGMGVKVDIMNNVWVGGATASTYISGPGGYDTSYNGGDRDGLLLKFNSDGNLIWHTYLGGSGGHELVMRILIDENGDLYCAGFTGSTNFPEASQGHFKTFGGGTSDGFLSKLNPNNGQPLWSTYIGGSDWDQAHDIAFGLNNEIIIVGWTYSNNFQTLNPYDSSFNGGVSDGFAASFSKDGPLLWSTYLGGNFCDSISKVDVNGAGEIFIMGYTEGGFPLAENNHAGSRDAILAKLDSSGVLLSSRYIGGSDTEEGNAILADVGGVIYAGGFTRSSDFPIKNGYDMNFSGSNDGFLAKFICGLANQPPNANAGENISISTEDIFITTIEGIGTDADNDYLEYRWLEGQAILLDWTSVGEKGECLLNLSTTSLGIGTYNLTLEVTDLQATVSDGMIITIENSAPHAAPIGEGVYEINTDVILGAQVSDYDGDLLDYQWLEGTEVLCFGQIRALTGGDPVTLPSFIITDFSLGTHPITLSVNDGINDPVNIEITIEVIDTTVPALAPVPNKTILWPPNHQMVDIIIEANAHDNSEFPPTLTAIVTSNEPQDGLGDGDMVPDWTELVINQDSGIITLQLRSERSGSGDGRVYTITITATDDSDNSSSADVEVIVPHDKRK